MHSLTTPVAATSANLKEPTRVLIVEDHPVVRDGLVQLLSRIEGVKLVDAVGNAKSAREVILREKPGMVLLDLMLGGSDGLALISELAVAAPTTRILVISMMSEAIYAERAMRAGAVGYVMKSAETDEVIRAVKSVCDNRVYLSPKIFVTLFRGLLKRSSFGGIPGAEGLSDREMQVFQLIGTGTANRDIATQLGISVKTVESHRENLKKKLGLSAGVDLCEAAAKFVNSLVEGGSLKE